LNFISNYKGGFKEGGYLKGLWGGAPKRGGDKRSEKNPNKSNGGELKENFKEAQGEHVKRAVGRKSKLRFYGGLGLKKLGELGQRRDRHTLTSIQLRIPKSDRGGVRRRCKGGKKLGG